VNVIACPSMLRTAYRCGSCGNLTRFGVEASGGEHQLWNVLAGNQPKVRAIEVLGEVVDRVTCQWCGHGRNLVPPGHKEH
jgi:DNA-directed RNA polymerase subunit RPC12/RpoP